MTRRGPFVGRLDHLGVFRSGPDELRHARQWRRIHLRLQRHGLPDGQVVARRGAKRERRDLHARPAGRLMGEFDAQGNTQEEIVWLGDMPLAVVARTGAISSNIGYIFADQINAPRAVVNSQDNSLLWSWFQTDPFGRVEPNNNPQGLGVYDFDMRLPGQVHDKETGLDHNNARDYDPAIGRFVQSDPMGIAGGLNSYVYVNNSPLIGIDVSGLVNLNLSPRNQVIYQNEELTTNHPGLFIVGGHGSPYGIYNPIQRVGSLGREPELTAAQVASLIQQSPDYHQGDIIRLDSCNTGVSPGDRPAFAQLLSNILGAEVDAPNNFVWIPEKNETEENGTKPWSGPFLDRSITWNNTSALTPNSLPGPPGPGDGYVQFFPRR